jgi:hypothetical protein
MNPERATEHTFRAFVCHASEDNELARRIASDLHANGIDTFFAEWEIRAGDSLRRKIDAGLESCTHFIVLVTPTSLNKAWVNAEIDAAFIRKVEGSAVLIPLRYELEVERLPPLLRGLLSPAIRNYDADVKQLIADIQGVSLKPPIQAPRGDAAPAWGANLSLSPLAAMIAEAFARGSKNGRTNDPKIDVGDMLKETGASTDDLSDAISELADLGWLKPRRVMGSPPFGYRTVTPTEYLFLNVDRAVMGWDPEQDAIRVAAEIVNDQNRGLQSHDIAARLGWTPRRLNPALAYLIGRDLVMASQNIDATFVSSYVAKNERTRRFVRDSTL